MNKSELIDAIATKANASKAATAVVLNATLEAIAEALANGESVQLIGFGTFSWVSVLRVQAATPRPARK